VSVLYAVDVTAPDSGKIRVAMTVRNNTDDEVRLAIPAWAPGAYRIVKYCKQVWNVEASGKDGARLEVAAVDDQTWKVKTGGIDRFVISYELTVEKSRMDKEHCFIAGPDTYLYLVNHKEAPCSVGFTLPEGWKVGTGLEADGPLYKARDYDTFIDCPTELGKFELFTFEADGATFDLVVHAKGPVDGPKLTEMCRKIVSAQHRIFGGAPPFKRYVFLYHFKDQTGGRGLEHLNSTDISMPYAAIKFDPLLAASVTSHEYFHLWNVKRIRPFELGPLRLHGHRAVEGPLVLRGRDQLLRGPHARPVGDLEGGAVSHPPRRRDRDAPEQPGPEGDADREGVAGRLGPEGLAPGGLLQQGRAARDADGPQDPHGQPRREDGRRCHPQAVRPVRRRSVEAGEGADRGRLPGKRHPPGAQ
jgi:hypothetical protein